MPELPEVEITRRGVAPHLTGRRVERVVVRERRLRWPVPRALERDLPGQRIDTVERRGKYLLLRTGAGTVIAHLGMSGSLRVLADDPPVGAHDHLDIVLEEGVRLRLTDPRRFGAVLWTRRDPLRHRLLADLGPEPLDRKFDGAALHARARGRRVAVKQFLMNAQIVAGLGNIYANEALFLARVHPLRAAGRISAARYDTLAGCIRQVLEESITQGGTTLRDFTASDGQPGYFKLRLRTYGRGGEPCPRCERPVRHIQQGQRSTFYCVACQT